jgi:hypothetical protein
MKLALTHAITRLISIWRSKANYTLVSDQPSKLARVLNRSESMASKARDSTLFMFLIVTIVQAVKFPNVNVHDRYKDEMSPTFALTWSIFTVC